MLLSAHGLGPFHMNYCTISAACHGGSPPAPLLRCYESPGHFDGGLQLICIVASAVSHLSLDNTPNTPDGIQVRPEITWPVTSFGPAGKGNQPLHRAHQPTEARSVLVALTLDSIKHSGPTAAGDLTPQSITDCGNFTLDLRQCGFCVSPLFLQTLGHWFPNEMQKLLRAEKENFRRLI